MHRILGALLFCTGADGAFLRSGAAVTPDANTTDANSAEAGQSSRRVPVCRFCQKLCPINCFVGTCGLHLPYSVNRYEGSNQCYSCDPAVSVGINKDGDYLKCEAEESGMVVTRTGASASPYTQQQTIQQGPQGPAVPGNAGLSALKASKEAQIAVNAATKAAIFSSQAAEAATAKYRQATVSGAGGDSNDPSGGQTDFGMINQAQNHQMATQIRVEECLRVAEAEHTSWKAAMDKYNQELEKLRRQQVFVDMAEKTLEAAEAASEKARGQCSTYQAEAQRAVEDAMKAGGPLSQKIMEQAASEELAGAAMAAHRRLVIAAKEAKDATQKIAIVSAMTPCATPGGPASTASDSGTTPFFSSAGSTVASASATSSTAATGTGATGTVNSATPWKTIGTRTSARGVAPGAVAAGASAAGSSAAGTVGTGASASGVGAGGASTPGTGATTPTVVTTPCPSINMAMAQAQASAIGNSLHAVFDSTCPASSTAGTGQSHTLQGVYFTKTMGRSCACVSAGQKALVQVPRNPPMNIASFAGVGGASQNTDLDEPALTLEGQLKMPSVAQEMSTSIVNKLTDNPAAVNDASIFALPTAAFSSDQVPVYGMTLQPISPADNLVNLEEPSTDPSLLRLPTEAMDRTTQLQQQMLLTAADSAPLTESASMFAAPTSPFSPEQVPLDGMMQTPAFDPSTFSALQQSERHLLRQGGTHW